MAETNDNQCDLQRKKEESVTIEDEEESEEKYICRLSHPAHPHTIVAYNSGQNPPAGCFGGVQGNEKSLSCSYHYRCKKCDVGFHIECHLCPRKMTHPYHPQHPLSLTALNGETRIIYDVSNKLDYIEKSLMAASSSSGIHDPGNIFRNCTWCGQNLDRCEYFYRCSICNFCLCDPCSQNFPLPIIQKPKSHHHPLIFISRPLLVPCDACGLVERSEPSYACFQCNYVVHRYCIGLPRVIKITRHPHRLSFTPFLSSTIFPSCPICYKAVDIKYSQYVCNHDDCSYVVHSKCATHRRVWDGIELEWEPEAFDKTEDVAPFIKVGDDMIKYFCHEHHLKLKKYDVVRDTDKQCQSCTLHIDSRDFYNCMQCGFFLHEVCANLPRKLHHALHHHPLFLDPIPPRMPYIGDCFICAREFAGFKYKCTKKNCDDYNINKANAFQIDVGCILLPDCFTHKSHEHPLFIPISKSNDIHYLCGGCKVEKNILHLRCTVCEFALCYECATIPDKLHYKYDAVPLSLCYGEVSDETYWCEVCEGTLDPREWFYTCNKPNITIHCKCVFGRSAYMKPGYTFDERSLSVKVICNDSSTRPFCNKCKARCSSSVYFKLSDETTSCSISCYSFWVQRNLDRAHWRLYRSSHN
ncbi:uncharacterized protein LOC111831554 [Capsella rubella]|uniref:uncharacterized protein LOC111831554 n=1 Tax=Capsella rubella TaxID=81985 RepID=UPI000CD5B23A|nr:uncharacterized protein LOC111831554 [Capsella rubella]